MSAHDIRNMLHANGMKFPAEYNEERVSEEIETDEL
jgi:hypothetical protein